MIGSIMMLTAMAAARPDRSKPRIRIQVAKMNRPARIDGSAVMASTTVRTNRENRLLISLRNTAVDRPSGTVMAMAMPMMMSVPTMAWPMPPTVMGSAGPAELMSWV